MGKGAIDGWVSCDNRRMGHENQGTPPEGTKPRKNDYPRCGAKKKTGGTCGKPAGWGTPHKTGTCSAHLGNSRHHVKRAQAELARQACERYGIAVEVDAGEALLQMVYRTYGSVQWLEAAVAGLEELHGPTFHVTGIPTGEEKPHVLWVMLMAERKLHKDVCVDALRADVSSRAIKLAEDVAGQLVKGMMEFAKAMGHDPGAPEVRLAAGEALRLVAGGDNG